MPVEDFYDSLLHDQAARQRPLKGAAIAHYVYGWKPP
jgi:hypothetical protein